MSKVKYIKINSDLLADARKQIKQARLDNLAKEQAFSDMRKDGLNVAYIEIIDND